jgi:hypothetical protein
MKLNVIFFITARPKTKKVQEEVYNGEETNPIETSGLQGEGDSFLLDSRCGPPLPDKEGLTISTSWAILNDDESHISSPHLSPVDSETSLSIINGTDNESALDNNWDDSASNTVLEAGDQSTILVENGRSAIS